MCHRCALAAACRASRFGCSSSTSASYTALRTQRHKLSSEGLDGVSHGTSTPVYRDWYGLSTSIIPVPLLDVNRPCTKMPRTKIDINMKILEQLECPVCLETCTPPIYNCINGHSFCDVCRQNLQECGVCRAPGRPFARCLILDSIANMVQVPCKNQSFGCKRNIALCEFEAHVAECTFTGTAYCVLCAGWRGTTLKSFIGHLMAYHKANVLSLKSSGIYEIATSIFKPGNENFLDVVMSHNNTNFWLHLKYNHATEFLNCTMRLINNASVSQFQYTIAFKAKNSDASMNFTKVVSALKEFIPEAHSNIFIPKGIINHSDQEVCFTVTIKK